jgi:hypothetical protein
MSQVIHTSLGDLISVLYEEFLAVYGDPDIASVATAATINDMLAESAAQSRAGPAAVGAESAA